MDHNDTDTFFFAATAHITYDVGLNLIRQFLTYAGNHTVDDVQTFTSQWVPTPTWAKTENVEIPKFCLTQSADYIARQLGPDGVQQVGGKNWWQWRPPQIPLKAEWIEMKKDYTARRNRGGDCQRCMFYIHGGAYYFGSVDEHRYQMIRHARKLQARLLAPRYRLAPEFPFPCGLQDCLAAYLHLLNTQPPETIILAGDSAGGGMLVSMMVILRDQGIPLPAGAILISPWVDLTHSFPSVAGNNQMDYVPPHGFQHKPSMNWPPPDLDDLRKLDETLFKVSSGEQTTFGAARDQSTTDDPGLKASMNETTVNQPGLAGAPKEQRERPTANLYEPLVVDIDGKSVELKDQIQIYAPNHLLSHPLVSPITQVSLGGLPPLCVIVGGGEMLRDEQIYLAHKAANPSSYPPPHLAAYGAQDGSSLPQIHPDLLRYPPTDVQLQIWDDLCHVAVTLSFTRPAKFQFRSIAQFGAWALAKAQKSEVRILDDDEVSMISSASSEEGDANDTESVKSFEKSPSAKNTQSPLTPSSTKPTRRPKTAKVIGRAGEPLPAFKGHMIRQRVTRHGEIYEMEMPTRLHGCTIQPKDVGVIKEGPVRKWLAAQRELNERFGDDNKDIKARRLKEMADCAAGKGAVFTEVEGNADTAQERPPPTAWASRSHSQLKELLKASMKKRISRGLAVWSGWGSHHDEEAIEKEEEKVQKKEDVTMSVTQVRVKDPDDPSRAQSRNASRDLLGGAGYPGQTGPAVEASTVTQSVPAPEAQMTGESSGPSIVPQDAPASSKSNRASLGAGGIMPFKLATREDNAATASTITLTNASGIVTYGDEEPTAATSMTTAGAAGAGALGAGVLAKSHGKRRQAQVDSQQESNLFPEDDLPDSRPYSRASDRSDSRPDPIVVTGEAVAVPLRTPDKARVEHARASSKVNGEGLAGWRHAGDAVDKYPSGVTSSGSVADADRDDPGRWADGVIREIGRASRDGKKDPGTPVFEAGEVLGSKERPEPHRFVTAND